MKKELINLVLNASLSEIRAYPKPGNVHLKQDFLNTKYSDFLKAVYAFKEEWVKLYNKIIEKSYNNINNVNFSLLYTEFLISTTKKMMKVQSGGNVLFGHLLLLTPIFITSVVGENFSFQNETEFWDFNHKIIINSSYKDTMRLYEAIRIAQPGGMGVKEKYDVYNSNAFNEIKQDNITLLKIFKLSKSYDSLSYELFSNYYRIRNNFLPFFDKELTENMVFNEIFEYLELNIIAFDLNEKFKNYNEIVVKTYLYILSELPDSLIIRKNNEDIALKICKKARYIIDRFQNNSINNIFNELIKFDKYLQKYNGKLNPGSTADILACTIFSKFALNYLGFKK